MLIQLSEEQLTLIIKQAFVHYENKEFGFATFTERPEGIDVQFHDAACGHKDEDEEPARRREGGVMKRFLCWIGWHGTIIQQFHDGASYHAKCNWCGYEGMIDSQGNLF